MRFAAFLFAVVLAVSSAFADVPGTMTYQAIFTDLEGNVMPDGVYTIGFHIFTGPTGGPPVWSEWQDVTVTDGVFEVILGTIFPLTIQDFLDPEGNGQWLSLEYNQTWMHPRQFISSVPYAFIACLADSARKLGVHTPETITEFQNTTDNRLDVHENTLDTHEACIDTLKDQIDSVRVGLIGGSSAFAGGVFSHIIGGDIVGEEEESFESPQFEVATNAGIIYFVQLVNDGLEHLRWEARIQLLDVEGEVVDQVPYYFQAASRADMHVQKALANLAAGSYSIRVLIVAVDGEVDVDDIQFGAMWIPSALEPTR